MSETARFEDLPPWDSADQQAGRSNASLLVDLALNRPTQLDRVPRAETIQKLGICGAGVMGAGIAAASLRHEIAVHLYDIAPTAVECTVSQLTQELGATLAPEQSSEVLKMLVTCAGQEELAACDLVLESVIEDRALKTQILTDLASHMRPQGILATNTSTIPIGDMGSMLPHPERFCGLHFCNPVAQRRLVEVVRGKLTSEQTIAAARDYVIRIGKLPIVVQDCPGFLVNRLLLPYVNEALEMTCQGADILAIDAAARSFGMALGPIQLLDMVGTDVAYRAGKMMWESCPTRVSLTPILPALVKRKRLGQKTGRGFYRYECSQSEGEFDDELNKILAPYLRNTRKFTTQEITARLFLPMVLEAARLIEEEVVSDVRDVDIGLIHGLAFPESRGGLLYWADTLGAAKILALLKPLESLGERMQPPELLRTLAGSKRSFYDLVP